MAEEYDSKRVQTQGSDAYTQASVLKVDNAETWFRARELRRMAKLLDAQAEKHYKEIKAPINKARGDILELEHRDREPMQNCLELLDPQIVAYEANEKMLREDLQIKMEAEAKRMAEEQRSHELQRLRLEQQFTRADELEKKPLYIAPVVVPDNPAMLDGEGRIETWEGHCHDLKELCKAYLDGHVPENVIEPNSKVLNGLARTLKEMFSIPGCTAVKKRSITQR